MIRFFLKLFMLLLIIALFLMLVLPPFFSEKYKPDILNMIQEKTGKEVQAEDISVALLPSIKFTLKNANINNIEGASYEHMLKVKDLSVSLSWPTLIAGYLSKNITISNIKLEGAELHLEKLQNGQSNWELTNAAVNSEPQTNNNQPAQAANTNANSGNDLGFAINKLTIQDTDITYNDAFASLNQQVNDINLKLSLESLQGPFDLTSNFIYNGYPLELALKTGKIISNERVDINLATKYKKDNFLQVNGNLLTSDAKNISIENSNFNGELIVGSYNPAMLAQEIGLSGLKLPSIETGIHTIVEAKKDKVTLNDMAINIGKDQIAGLFSLQNDNQQPILQLILKGNSLDLDAIIASLTEVKQQGDNVNTPAQPTSEEAQTIAQNNTDKPLIPMNIKGLLDVDIKNLTYNGKNIDKVSVHSELLNQNIRSELDVLLPVESRLYWQGSTDVSSMNAKLDGAVKFNTKNITELLNWIKAGTIAGNELKELSISSNVIGSPQSIIFDKLNVASNGSNINGQVTLDRSKNRPYIQANLNMDTINLNPWLASYDANSKLQSSPAAEQQADNTTNNTTADKPIVINLPIDFNTKIKIANLIYQDMQFKGIDADIIASNNNIAFNKFSVAQFVDDGSNLSVSGQLNDTAKSPIAKDLKVIFASSNPYNLTAKFLTDTSAIQSIKNLGEVQSTTTLNGNINQMVDINTNISALGGSYALSGKVSKSTKSIPNMNFRVTHNNIQNVVNVFQPATKIPTGLRNIDIAGSFAANNANVYNIKLNQSKVGNNSIKNADIKLDLAAAKPYISVNANAAYLDFDNMNGQSSGTKSNGNTATSRPKGQAPWNDNVINMDAIKSVNMDANLKSDKVLANNLNLTNVNIAAKINNGLLSIENLTANGYGGLLSFNGSINANNTNINSNINIKDVALKGFTKDLANVSLPLGKLNFTSKLNSTGNTSAKIISNLNGNGSLNVSGISVGDSGGFALLSTLTNFANIGGGGQSEGLLAVNSNWTSNAGIVNIANLNINGPITGTGNGIVDLPKWLLDIKGNFNIKNAILLELLKKQKSDFKNSHPFRIYGSIDNPQYELPSDISQIIQTYSDVKGGNIINLLGNELTGEALQKLGVDSNLLKGLNSILGTGGNNNSGASDIIDNVTKGVVSEVLGGNNNGGASDIIDNVTKGVVSETLGGSAEGDIASQILGGAVSNILGGGNDTPQNQQQQPSNPPANQPQQNQPPQTTEDVVNQVIEGTTNQLLQQGLNSLFN